LAFLIGAIGCGGMSATDVETLHRGAAADTAASFAEARDRALTRHVLTAREDGDVPPLEPNEQGEVPEATRVFAAAPDRSLTGRESIVLYAAGSQTPRAALVVPSCADGNSCGCEEPVTYVMAVDLAGRDVVLRMTPVDHTESVHQAGACGYGCGVPTPPRPPYVYLLRGSPESLRVIDVPYDRHSVSVSCDEMIAAP
jgi:hypothetical protein